MSPGVSPLTKLLLRGTRNPWEDVSGTGNYYGGWLDNSIFIAEQYPRLDPPGATPRYIRTVSMGRRDNNPIAGVYQGDAVDTLGNWGTSALNYVGGPTGGRLGLRIDIPAHSHRGEMVWSDIPVDNDGSFDNGIRFADLIIGPNKVVGSFYQGGEVGGNFTWRYSVGTAYLDNVFGAFGAKRTP